MKQLWVALADHLARAKFTLTLAKSYLGETPECIARQNSNEASGACSNECIEKCMVDGGYA